MAPKLNIIGLGRHENHENDGMLSFLIFESVNEELQIQNDEE